MSAPFVEYLQAGLCVIPIRADGSKAPALSGWLEYQQRLPTIEEARDWEKRYEGIAIVGGEVSGNVEVIDIDEPALVRPFLEAVRAQDATLYDRLCLIRTPRRNASGKGGCHAVYRCDGEIGGSTKLAMTEPEPVTDADGKPVMDPNTGLQKMQPRTLIETKARGGYFITVGSSARCHPTGNLYEHKHGPKLTDLETLTEAERQTLHEVARTFDRSVAETHVEPPVRGYERARPGESPGDEFNQRTSWAEILQPHGWQLVGESGGIKRWRRPGKASGISATTGILSKAGNELLTEGKGRSRYEVLTEASGRFKGLATKHNCPVLVPSQLNREAAKGEEAGAHNLKESGALEQDADVVILVRWPWKADPDREPDAGRYVFRICKNRNRPIVHWQVEARFNPARQTIETPQPNESRGYREFDEYSGSQSEE